MVVGLRLGTRLIKGAEILYVILWDIYWDLGKIQVKPPYL